MHTMVLQLQLKMKMTNRMTQDIQELQKRMQIALEAYKVDITTAKPYFTSMKEISSWLAKKEK